MNKKRKILSKTAAVLLAVLFAFQAPLCALAFTGTSMFTGKTYTHQSRFKGKTIYEGIDVSKHNGDINWKKVKKAGVDFAIIRVGFRGYGKTGSLNKDIRFDENMQEALEQGIKVGVYFYSQALTEEEARDEAEFALKYAKEYKFDLPIFYDYEWAGVSTGRLDSAWKNGTLTKKKMTANAIAFCETIENAGYSAMIYASKSFLEDNVDNEKISEAGYGTWLAHYATKTGYEGEFSIWQYSSKGKVSGCNDDNNGYVDSNFMYGKVWEDYFKVSDISKRSYTGSEIEPSVTVTYKGEKLKKDIDYTVKYKNNIQIGTASAIVTGIGDYASEGTKNVKFLIVPPKTEGLSKKSSTTSSVTIKWNKNEYADCYKVQIWYGKKWNTVGTTDKTSYKISDLSPSTKFYIRVASGKKVGSTVYYSSYCDKVRAVTKVAKVTKLTAKTTTSSITFSWKKQSHASGYKIYKYNYKTKKYKFYKKITSGKTNYIKFSNLKAKAKIHIKVKAYKTVDSKTINGKRSDGFSARAIPNTPTLKSAKSPSERRIKVKWTKQSSVKGYQIKWSTTKDFSSNTKTQNVSKGSKTSATIKTARSGSKYYVKIRSYSVKNDKKYYSKWSNVKGLKTK